jgi:hypothetical protein
MQRTKLVRLEYKTHTKLTIEMAMSGLTRKKIVENAINMYLAFKKSERLLPMSDRIIKKD